MTALASMGPGRDLYQMFAAVAQRTPDSVALVEGSITVSYGELERRAGALAAQLGTVGVKPEVVVGVRLGRGVDLVVSMLAVLRAGGVYLPVEAQLPAPRCRTMLVQGRARVLITRPDLAEAATADPVEHMVLIDGDGSASGGPPDAAAAIIAEANLAYITFTSGSTGAPKAVGTTHGSAAEYLRFLAVAGHLTPDDTTLQLAAPSFDASVRDMLGPLTVGARVVLVPDVLVGDGPALWELLRQHTVTCLPSLVPATLRLLGESAPPPDADGHALRRVLVSGETLTASAVQAAVDRLGAGLTIVNHYGPTECTMTSTFHVVGPAAPPPVPIGRPPAWGRIYLLDDTLSPVPPGQVGDIYIGGAGVTRGYLNLPGATAARFLPDPFADGHGARMYRTGDRGRFRADGTLDFLGRTDTQLNVNGVRIEPGEVERILQAHEAVAEAAVGAMRGTHGGSLLVGYVVGQSGHIIDTDELRQFTRTRLPEALVPKVLLTLPGLPRTARGKLDRTALASYHQATAAAAGGAPRTADEAAMLAVWRQVLRRSDLGIHDNLFELGADSIVAMALVSRIRAVLGRAPDLIDIFRGPTVAAATRALPPAPAASAASGPERYPSGATGAVRTPLSFAQQRLWFFEKLLPGSPLNTIASAYLVHGRLDPSALGAATRDVVLRHDALRTTFVTQDGSPICHVAATGVDACFDVVPVSTAEALVAYTDELARRPLDIGRGPLLRVTLLDAGAARVLLVRVHHLVADARSVEIILADLAAAYRLSSTGRHTHDAPERQTYADYVRWQHAWLTDEETARHLEFWRAELTGAPPVLELPFDRARPAVQRYRGAIHHQPVDPRQVDAAATLARAEATSLFTVLLATWATLLSRLGGQDELVIGVPISGRGRPEFDDVVGLFVNTLPVRVTLTGAPTFRQLLRQVRDRLFRTLAHRDFPFERLVEHLHPERSLAYGPVFQTVADLQRATVPDFDGARLTPLTVDTATARFDISLSLLRYDARLVGLYTFNTDLFDRSTVERLAGHFDTLLGNALADPDRSTSALSVLDVDQRQALTALQQTDGGTPSGPRHWSRVPERFAEQVRHAPARTALTYAGRHLSYAALGRAVDRLATRLRAAGIGAETVVAVCANRTPDLVVALLGVLRTGAAYLPLDPTHPPDRLGQLIRDARAAAVLTDPDLMDRLAGRLPAGVRLWPLGHERTGDDDVATSWPRPRGDQLAYVIYTSGSTGTPKGVEVTHAGLAHVLAAVGAAVGIGPDDALVAVTTVSFDIAALELFLPLTHGARVVLAGSEVSTDPARLGALLRTEAATMMQATPATWQPVAELTPAPALRVALCGGEALPRPLATALPTLATAAYNVYGPTETTIWSTIARLTGAPGPVSIGAGLGRTGVLILDDRLDPVPPGVVGELYLSGPGVARGYRDRPDLTAAHFLPDPYSATPGGRMYRTGDLCRRHADGRLEYLGRADRQIKVRGFRIEPAEVERVLLTYPPIRRAAVAAVATATSAGQLAAYIVADGPVDTDRLRDFLARRLPRYLVPTRVVRLDALPLTANGKVDVARLPAPDDARPHLSTAFRPPRSDTEHAIATIWADVLGVAGFGADDNFFDLGGHSLRAIQVMSRVNEAFGTALELYVLFADPTVGRLAVRVEGEVIGQILAEDRAEPGRAE